MPHNQKQLTYEEFINREAKLINSDGCTGITNVHGLCCKIHDIEYRYHKNSLDAYQAYLDGYHYFWIVAKDISKSDVDRKFRRCLQSNSVLGYFSPISYIRWLGVKLFGGKAWKKSK